MAEHLGYLTLGVRTACGGFAGGLFHGASCRLNHHVALREKTMTKAIYPLLTLGVISLMACSKDDEDPLSSACNSTCAVESTHPCAAQQAKCISDCLAYANQVQKEYNSTACAVCIAKTSSYSVKDGCTTGGAECCWGPVPLQRPEQVPSCASKCYEPDGGAAY
jgi:hypothetical protein